MSIFSAVPGPGYAVERMYALGAKLAAAAPTPSYNLHGTLYLSSSGWLCLAVPAPLIRGLFAAMHEPGIELPRNEAGAFEPHISVMSKAEVDMIGPERISERGKSFAYSIGRLMEVEPAGWPDVSKAWFCAVFSPSLQALRRSYGLSSLPHDGEYAFHVTVAVRKRGVLGRNEKAKAA